MKKLDRGSIIESSRGLKGWRLSKKEKLKKLEEYKLGLEYALSKNYPNKFPFELDLDKIEKLKNCPCPMYKEFFERGEYVGKQLGPLEIDNAREYLLSEIEKRKTKFSKKGLIYRLFNKEFL